MHSGYSCFLYYCFTCDIFKLDHNQERTFYKEDSWCDTVYISEILFVDNTYRILKLKSEIEENFLRLGYEFDFDVLIKFLNGKL